MTLLIALVWIVASPIWLYAFVSIKDVVEENRIYISLLGIAALGAWAAERAPIPVASLVVLYALRTIQRNRVWASPVSFAATCFIESPLNHRAQLNYAVALQETGMLSLAAEHYVRLIKSGTSQGGQAAANLAAIRLQEGRFEETIGFLPHCIKLWPGVADMHTNLGTAFFLSRRLPEAERQFHLALLLEPDSPEALRNRARVRALMGHKKQAREDAERAEQLDGHRLTIR